MANRYWVGGTANWNLTTSWSATSGGASGASVPTISDNAFFDQAGTYTATVNAVSICANLTVSAGLVTISISATMTLRVVGNIDFTGSNTSSVITGFANSGFNLGPSSGGSNSYTLKMAGILITGALPVTFGSTSSGNTWTLLDNFVCEGAATFAGGIIVLNNKTLSCGSFIGTSVGARELNFGSSSSIILTGSGTALNLTNAGTPTFVGTPQYVFTYSGATALTCTAYSPGRFYFTSGTYALTYTPNITFGVATLDFTGFSGSWTRGTPGQAFNITENLTLSSTMTSPTGVGTGICTFNGTSGTQIITSAGKTLDFPITFNGIGGTFQLADALTVGATRALTLTNGTFDGNNKTISGASAFSITTGSVSIANISTALPFTLTSGTMTLAGNCAFGAFTFTAGSLVL